MIYCIIGSVLWCIYAVCVACSGVLATSTVKWGIATLLIPVPELICIGIILFVLHLYKRNKVIVFIEGVLSLLFIGISLFQFFYYALSGEFVSALAVENINQAYLIINGYHVAGILFIFLFWLLYLYCLRKWGTTVSDIHIKTALSLMGIFLICSFVIVWQNGCYMNKTHLNKYIVGQSPIIGLYKNFNQVYFHFGNSYNNVQTTDYAYIKNFVYGNDLPFAKKDNSVSQPNVIIIFTEGTSSRLLGCYGGHYSDLTPNMDNFSQSSMVVDNYFNHTAATFRGTLGQLASAYPEHGGYEKAGWVSDTDNKLETKKYQTLPNVLNQLSYDTYFISPHKTTDPYTKLLKMLKFKKVYTLDSMSELLERNPNTNQDGTAVYDSDMYNSVIQFLKNRNADKPFMLSLYVFGTHAFIDVPDGGIRYKIDNASLNTLHNNDAAFGKFWEYFKNSPYSQNTIVILTADHAHYYDKTYMNIMNDNPTYKKIFVDKIPLIIYDPTHDLPTRYDANDCTSLDLTPTILQLMDIKNVKNSFMGHSIFDALEVSKGFHIAAIGEDFYGLYNHQIYKENEIDQEHKSEFDQEKALVHGFYKCEEDNSVFR